MELIADVVCLQPIFPVSCSVDVSDVLKTGAHSGFISGYKLLVSRHVAGRASLEISAHE